MDESRQAKPGRGIIWLASYPKSGNTWFRAFLSQIQSGEALPDLDSIGYRMPSNRSIFDHYVGIDSAVLTHGEADLLRPKVYELLAESAAEEVSFLKTHDAFTFLPSGEPLLSGKASLGAIYLIRNPLDVAVSQAFHAGHEDFDRAVGDLCDPAANLAGKPGKFEGQLRQQLLTWSGHVRSWLGATIPVHVLRYEDMKMSPLDSFRGAIRFARLTHDDEAVQQALDRCRLDRLQELEDRSGFAERWPSSRRFFRKGKVGGWREFLSAAQARKVIDRHREVMREFGYLTENDEPTI